uniref:Uncharacterized protein n=1 Tax=Erwinia amylovora ATCC BAA-2158 TaxID=889211 RepID=E5B242_ERWAM|nr:hypothetical protein predicted by Glimmer/Critica [Erwinia amylovora ATCC BAA-2158]
MGKTLITARCANLQSKIKIHINQRILSSITTFTLVVIPLSYQPEPPLVKDRTLMTLSTEYVD